MNKKNKTIEWRNKEIYADFCAHLRNNQPVMLAYAAVAHRYDLSEESIRKIIKERSAAR